MRALTPRGLCLMVPALKGGSNGVHIFLCAEGCSQGEQALPPGGGESRPQLSWLNPDLLDAL
jgi:hypothetical protein